MQHHENRVRLYVGERTCMERPRGAVRMHDQRSGRRGLQLLNIAHQNGMWSASSTSQQALLAE